MADRFTHLLQPIRDLAVNWDVDIASALEEYLEDLEGITVTLGEELRSAVNDGDEIETINFAEAALLIQVRHNKKFVVVWNNQRYVYFA